MSSREQILQSVRENQAKQCDLPAVPLFHASVTTDLRSHFTHALRRMAGDTVEEFSGDLQAVISARFPAAKIICSAVPEYAGSSSPSDYTNPATAADIDVTVVRSPLGVAETGSVLLSERELGINAVGVLAHDIVVLLDPEDIVENIHDAYTHRYFNDAGYCLLMTGPSGSADISGVTVHPAQATMTLTVVFVPKDARPADTCHAKHPIGSVV